MGKLRAIAVLPTLLTLGNLVCGFFAIVVSARIGPPETAEVPTAAVIEASNPLAFMRALDKTDPIHNCMLAGWLIFLAMVFDALDGQVARLAKTSSDFGGQLDSLCDAVTFGVAPAFLLVKMCPQFTFFHTRLAWIIAAWFACCAAMRLARFNAETHEDDDHFNFSGLPSPAAAASIAGFAILFYTLTREDHRFAYGPQLATILQWALPLFALLVGGMMVSRIPYPHFTNHLLHGERSFGHVLALVLTILCVALMRGYALPLACVGYVLLGPVRYAWEELVQRRPHKEPMF